MIVLRRLDHVALRTPDVGAASARWTQQFGLAVRSQDGERALLACDDEPYALELLAGAAAGLDHVAWELDAGCSLEVAREHLKRFGAEVARQEETLVTADADDNSIQIVAYREPSSMRPPHARPPSAAPLGHPRKLGHVNFLTDSVAEQVQFYSQALGMRMTDWLGEDEGAWLRIGSDHHVMALVGKGNVHLHHLAFDVVDIGQMRMALDHLGRHGRWLGWGPVRHGVGGNIASYVRIVEEECFVELYCDMEQLPADHVPRRWPDDRFSSNTWGPLPPRSYFRFDAAAVESERDSLEMLGMSLPPVPVSEMVP